MVLLHPAGTEPSPGSILRCHFPLIETPQRPGPKLRPALVRTRAASKDGKRAYLQVTYGTSRIIGTPPFTLIIDSEDELRSCGLSLPTCFHLDRSVWLPWAEEFFPRVGQSVPWILGQLPQSARLRLASATGR